MIATYIMYYLLIGLFVACLGQLILNMFTGRYSASVGFIKDIVLWPLTVLGILMILYAVIRGTK